MAFLIYCIRSELYFQLDGSSHFEENFFYKHYDEQVLIFSRVGIKKLGSVRKDFV